MIIEFKKDVKINVVPQIEAINNLLRLWYDNVQVAILIDGEPAIISCDNKNIIKQEKTDA